MDWDLIKYFLAVAEGGSASAAAKALGVNHATVLRKLDNLETATGLVLFIRAQQGYRLTAHGKSLLRQAKLMDTCVNDLLRQARGLQHQPEGKLVVSKPETSLLDLSPVFERFCRQYPQIQLELQTSAERSNLARLEADVALRLTNQPPEHLVGKRLASITFSAYCSPGYYRQLAQPVLPGQCLWLLWTGAQTSESPEAHHPDRLLAQDLGEQQIRMRCNSVSDTLAYTRHGLGVSLFADPVASTHKLIRLPFKTLLERYRLDNAGLWLLHHPDMRHSERVSVFRQFMAREIPLLFHEETGL